ncbi:uncharacterized protein LOC135957489 [Calliphora vicina]|uniref:uncharacterized protein LOC135957489 n=1 Tax=Calliphora vicina TaxID=7373 RepID=UPI00325B7743
MFTNNFLKLTLVVSVLLYTLNVLQQVESVKLDENTHQYPVVYRRLIRRRPPMHPHDKYMEEILEIFHTKEKPPSNGELMTDEDVDKFIYCDFNRHLEECKQYWDSQKRKRPIAPTTSKPLIITSTTAKTTTTTFASEPEPEPTDVIPGIPPLDVDGEYVNYELEEDEHELEEDEHDDYEYVDK